MRSSKLFHGILLVILLAIGGVVVRYYWLVDSLDAIRILPRYLILLFLAYVLLQVLKRWLYKERNWWDWIYYIGLASAMLPTFMASTESIDMFQFMSKYGTLFLIIPVALDLYTLMKQKR